MNTLALILASMKTDSRQNWTIISKNKVLGISILGQTIGVSQNFLNTEVQFGAIGGYVNLVEDFQVGKFTNFCVGQR